MSKEKPYFADAYNAVYIFHKKWSGDKFTDDDWENAIREAEEIDRKMNNPFARDMLFDALQEMERHNGHSPYLKVGGDLLIRVLKASMGVKTDQELCDRILKRGGE